MKRLLKPGRLILYVIIFGFIFTSFSSKKITIHERFTLTKGETLHKIYDIFKISGIKKYQMKRFLKNHQEEVKKIQPGLYIFSGKYLPGEILETFLAGPLHTYEHITVLEGRSIYDIDNLLAKKGLANKGEYLSLVKDKKIIDKYTLRYDFLSQAQKEKGVLNSLEGYLYPDTYYIDKDHNIVDDLVYIQLETFQKKIRIPYGKQLKNINTHLNSLGFTFKLSSYEALILASIVEKEEKVDKNRITISSVFFNRLESGMQIDADITLCYGLKKGYENCTPSVIIENLYNKNNLYNTRAVGGLPPTPISNITVGSIKGVLEAKKSDAYYYLHDLKGRIYVGNTLTEHNNNKRKYMNKK